VALSAIKAYVLLHDQPDLAHGPLPEINGAAGADDAERKKALKKAKKEQQRLEKIEADKREAARKAAANPKSAEGEVKKEDPDPLGNKLVQTKEPLQDAMKFLTPLLEFSPKNIEAQFLGFEVYIRRGTFLFLLLNIHRLIIHLGKYALALKCLSVAHSIDASHPTLHVQLLRFRQALNKPSEPLPPQVAEVVDAEFETLLPKAQKLDEWNNSFLAAHENSVPHKHAFLTSQQLLNPESRSQNEKELTSTLDASIVSLETALAGLDLLGEWGSDQAAKTTYAAKASSKWPESTSFRLG
jgi:peptide alpha-N-acetyltransferase